MEHEGPVKIDDTYTMLVDNGCHNSRTIARIIEDRDSNRLKLVAGILFMLGVFVGYGISLMLA